MKAGLIPTSSFSKGRRFSIAASQRAKIHFTSLSKVTRTHQDTLHQLQFLLVSMVGYIH